jgi:hypothetical protein
MWCWKLFFFKSLNHFINLLKINFIEIKSFIYF